MFKQTVKILVIFSIPTLIYANDTIQMLKLEMWNFGVDKVIQNPPKDRHGEVDEKNTSAEKTIESNQKVAAIKEIPEELIRTIKNF